MAAKKIGCPEIEQTNCWPTLSFALPKDFRLWISIAKFEVGEIRTPDSPATDKTFCKKKKKDWMAVTVTVGKGVSKSLISKGWEEEPQDF